mmetsp:Transcript_25315/g.60844  ORF Transcript_25315/g.60844 Transcript_25315/m.60844 type:complete len:91 (+) Transcript_25315:1890-2162(+)
MHVGMLAIDLLSVRFPFHSPRLVDKNLPNERTRLGLSVISCCSKRKMPLQKHTFNARHIPLATGYRSFVQNLSPRSLTQEKIDDSLERDL